MRRRAEPEGTGRKRAVTQSHAPQVGEVSALDWRLLQWLLRYPFQRADDLVIGVAHWVSRATVYRHLARLQQGGLIESVLSKAPGDGKRLYSLSNLGLHLLAAHLGRSTAALADEWGASEAGLLRLLPRLPVLLRIQDVVNGLITGAAEAMTTEGRRATIVRWTWQRDLTHRFVSREQPQCFFADGAVALCIRAQQADGTTFDRWYGLFLLSTDLDDERPMRLRLERLLAWRECPERWAHYQQMLPVLILARSPRQAEHWQHAVDLAALHLRLDPPHGAMACLPPHESVQTNPWLLGWRTLSTGASCHLQDVLAPLPRSVLSSLMRGVEGEEEEDDTLEGASSARGSVSAASPTAPTVSTVPTVPARLSRMIRGNLQERADKLTEVTRRPPDDRMVRTLLELQLTATERSVLALLLAHPLLSDAELALFLQLQRPSMRPSLDELRRLGCCEPITTQAGRRWHLTGRGLRVMAAENHLHVCTLATPISADDAAATYEADLVQRGESWLLTHVHHTAGIYGFFALLAQATRQHTEQELCWWETGAMCERRYQVNGQWHNLRPDALAEYRVGRQHLRFWLEWDRGTMNARDLAIKFSAYAQYIASREWARERSRPPLLLCVAPEIAQEKRLLRVARGYIADTPVPGLLLSSTTEELLEAYGPLAPIWMRSIGASNHSEFPTGTERQALFEEERAVKI